MDEYPDEVKKYRKIFFNTVEKNLQKGIQQLDVFIAKYPDFPVLTNWKISAMQLAGADTKTIQALIKEQYKKFPDYLFAKAAYAQLCLNNEEWEKIPAIFDNNFMLNELYPKRDVFHISEVKTFYHVIGTYYCYVKNIQSARACMQLLEKINATDELLALNRSFIVHCMMEFILSKMRRKKKVVTSVQEIKMIKKKGAIPLDVQDEIEIRVNAFNKKHMSKKSSVYYPEVKGKFIYLMYNRDGGEFEKVCRLTYNGDLENMNFAIFNSSSETYDPNEWDFPGSNHVNGTLEGAMKAGLKAYEV